MKNSLFLSIMLMFCFSIFSFAQDFHASTTKVEIEGNTLKLTAKFFTADLEKTINASTSNKNDFDSKAKAYATPKLTVKVNGENINLIYVGSQTNEKSTRLYLKADNVGAIQDIEIKNSMLIENFDDQQNLVTFDINGVRKSFTAKKGKDTGKVTF